MTLKCSCLNRSRQRRQLYHLSVSFSQLSGHLTTLEPQIYSFDSVSDNDLICKPFEGAIPDGSIYEWTSLHFLILSVRYFALGFDLNLYSLHEYPKVYMILNVLYSSIEKYSKETISSEKIEKADLNLIDSTSGASKVNHSGYLSDLKKFYKIQSLLCTTSCRV